jgi:hypothetical protein
MDRDLSLFYRLNEEIAHELERLGQAGHLDALRALVEAGNVELFVSTVRPAEGLEEVLGALRPDGWDHEGFLATRSQFTVTLEGQAPREVYMPDHICPQCVNESGNTIDSCSRVCSACGFAW